MIMKKTSASILTFSLLLPLTTFAEDWSKEQQEVLAFEEVCINSRDPNEYKACYHEDYVGWGLGAPVTYSKSDVLKGIDEDFATSDTETLLFKPVSVVVKGNMAVVNSVVIGKSTNKRTTEVEYYTHRWTDVCFKDGDKWYWISDHGEDISPE